MTAHEWEPLPTARLNLDAIALELEHTASHFAAINRVLPHPRSAPTQEVRAHLLSAYRYLDQVLEAGTELLMPGASSQLLELNHRVLMGTDTRERDTNIKAIRATEQHFFGDYQTGIGQMVQWCRLHASGDVLNTASGLYLLTICQPQLFIEGNHRTGTLLMSYWLCRNNLPPFVLTPTNAHDYFKISDAARRIHSNSRWQAIFQLPLLRRRLARILAHSLETRWATTPTPLPELSS